MFSIIRGSFHDGPGMRTVVYLSGCSLRCKWCHNPEGLLGPQVLRYAHKCIGCGQCIQACPASCYQLQGDTFRTDYSNCLKCFACTVCPSGAIVRCGEPYTPERLVQEAARDAHYFKQTGGGVTFSGGECLLHPEFVRSAATLLKQTGISVAVETALHVPWANVEHVLPVTDVFLADLKLMDGQKHAHYTGRHNRLILENLGKLAGVHENIMVRIPLIPGVNDDAQNLMDSAEFINQCGPGIQGMELLKYNPLAKSKYDAQNQTFTDYGTPQTQQEMEQKQAVVKAVLNRDIPVL